jgi:hypothetical protein
VPITIRRVDYFYATMQDRPGEAYQFLSHAAEGEVNFVAFHAVPLGPGRAQLTLFPEEPSRLVAFARRAGLALDGPHPALVVQGDDRLGAFADVHARLYAAGINVFSASGVTDGRGTFGYVVYVQGGDIERAIEALRSR